MRAWHLLACLALFIAVSSAFSVSSHSSEGFSGDLETAASDKHEHHESGFEEHGGSDFGEEHHKKVSLVKNVQRSKVTVIVSTAWQERR
jgi:hypothetical protein